MKKCKCFSRKSRKSEELKNYTVYVSVFGGDFHTVRLDCLGGEQMLRCWLTLC